PWMLPESVLSGTYLLVCSAHEPESDQKSTNRPMMNPKSPNRFTTKAFMPAFAFSRSSYQKAIRPQLQRPTPSHPKNITTKLLPITSSSMEKTNKFSQVKNRQ